MAIFWSTVTLPRFGYEFWFVAWRDPLAVIREVSVIGLDMDRDNYANCRSSNYCQSAIASLTPDCAEERGYFTRSLLTDEAFKI